MNEFKILITTTYYSTSGVGLRTDVVLFDDRVAAIAAAKVINSLSHVIGCLREATPLFSYDRSEVV